MDYFYENFHTVNHLFFELRPSINIVQTLLCSVHTIMTVGQYSSVRHSRSVSKRLKLHKSV